MMVSSSLVRPKKPSTSKEDFLHHPYQQYPPSHFEIFSVTRSSSASSSASISRDDSTHSIPSLYQAAGTPIAASASRSNHNDSRLAFTTEDLQLIPKCSATSRGSGVCDSTAGGGGIIGHHHPIIPSPTPGSMKPNKKRFVRHGLMVPQTSDLSDHTTEPSDNQKISLTSSSTPSGIPLRARPTVTTILRQQHVLEKAEQKERAKLEALMISNAAVLEVDNLSKEQGKKEQEVVKAAEAKRLLQSRLAYEKAIAASRKMAHEKQKIAESTRQEEKEWQSLLEQQRETEKERRKAMAESLQRANYDSKRAFDDMVRSKHIRANRVKQETEQLQAEAKIKKHQDDIKRQDRIQQIQAAKLALKRTKETMGNPNQFYRSIAIPETQIKLRLQKEEEKRKLQETRQKIQAAKQMKSVKLIRAMKKIQSCESLARKQLTSQQDQQLPPRPVSVQKLNSRPFSFPGKVSAPVGHLQRNGNVNSYELGKNQLAATKDEEMNNMMEQLKQLRTENYQKRINEKQRAVTSTSHTASKPVKVIGDSDHNKRSGTSDSLKKFYPHRSHYGIHV